MILSEKNERRNLVNVSIKAGIFAKTIKNVKLHLWAEIKNRQNQQKMVFF